MKVGVSLRRLPSGTWQIRFRAKSRKETNINLSKELTRKQADLQRAHYEREISLGRFDPWERKETPMLGRAIKDYIWEKKGDSWNAKTTKNKQWLFSKLQDNIKNQPLDHIHSWNWWKALDDAPVSKKGYYRDTKAFLNWCEDKGYIEAFDLELSQHVRKSVRTHKIKYITWQQVKELESWYLSYRESVSNFTCNGFEPERHVRLWWLMFWLCLRKEEAVKITKESIKGDYIEVPGKGGTLELAPIPAPAKEHIEWFINNPVSETLIGFTSMSSPKTQLRKAITQALPGHHSKGFHQFRHGGAVHYLSTGIKPIFVSKLMRHSSIQVTLSEYADIIKGLEVSVFEQVEDKPV
jgi:integrase